MFAFKAVIAQYKDDWKNSTQNLDVYFSLL